MHCVDEGRAIKVLVRLLRRLVQELPHGIVGQHQAYDLLVDQLANVTLAPLRVQREPSARQRNTSRVAAARNKLIVIS